jgi:hypothetical protein
MTQRVLTEPDWTQGMLHRTKCRRRMTATLRGRRQDRAGGFSKRVALISFSFSMRQHPETLDAEERTVKEQKTRRDGVMRYLSTVKKRSANAPHP